MSQTKRQYNRIQNIQEHLFVNFHAVWFRDARNEYADIIIRKPSNGSSYHVYGSMTVWKPKLFYLNTCKQKVTFIKVVDW